jgi:hypothetical protein
MNICIQCGTELNKDLECLRGCCEGEHYYYGALGYDPDEVEDNPEEPNEQMDPDTIQRQKEMKTETSIQLCLLAIMILNIITNIVMFWFGIKLGMLIV